LADRGEGVLVGPVAAEADRHGVVEPEAKTDLADGRPLVSVDAGPDLPDRLARGNDEIGAAVRRGLPDDPFGLGDRPRRGGGGR
jgi:hypothetical protein